MQRNWSANTDIRAVGQASEVTSRFTRVPGVSTFPVQLNPSQSSRPKFIHFPCLPQPLLAAPGYASSWQPCSSDYRCDSWDPRYLASRLSCWTLLRPHHMREQMHMPATLGLYHLRVQEGKRVRKRTGGGGDVWFCDRLT